MTSKKARTPKTTEKQFDLLLDFMSSNKILITGKLKPGEGPQHVQNLWNELCLILNSAGSGPEKSVEGWKKTWNEYKSHTKKRARELKIAQKLTGGGEAKRQLSDRDQRLLGLLSNVIIDGVQNVAEPGLLNVCEPSTSTNFYTNTSQTGLDMLNIYEPAINIIESNTTNDINLLDAEVVFMPENASSHSDVPVPHARLSQTRKRSISPEAASSNKRQRTKHSVKTTSAERATAAYAKAMDGRNSELANNTAAIKELASAMRDVATGIQAVANSIISISEK